MNVQDFYTYIHVSFYLLSIIKVYCYFIFPAVKPAATFLMRLRARPSRSCRGYDSLWLQPDVAATHALKPQDRLWCAPLSVCGYRLGQKG